MTDSESEDVFLQIFKKLDKDKDGAGLIVSHASLLARADVLFDLVLCILSLVSRKELIAALRGNPKVAFLAAPRFA